MKRVLILAYFFPPCNLTASNRAYGWVKYFHKFGIYPVVITRSWENEIKDQSSILQAAGKEIIIQKNDTHEVHILPYVPNTRDRFSNKSGFLASIISKALTVFSLVFQNFSFKAGNTAFFKNYIEKLLKKEKFDGLIITGNPFNLFKIGHFINKKYKTKWIADYRDDWCTSELTENNGLLFKLIRIFEVRSEKKWIKSASNITSISDYYVNKISDFTKVKGVEIINGYIDLVDKEAKSNENDFHITYNGSLYNTQPIEQFINPVVQYIKDNPEAKIKINFPGLLFAPEQGERINKLIAGHEDKFFLSNRIPHQEVLKIQNQSHMLLMVGHENLKGIPSSKIYEYMSLKKPILLINPDKDILEYSIKNCGLGFVAETEKEVYNTIDSNYKKFLAKQPIIEQIDENKLSEFSREKSAEKLAGLI